MMGVVGEQDRARAAESQVQQEQRIQQLEGELGRLHRSLDDALAAGTC
jgi:hypothetical protein